MGAQSAKVLLAEAIDQRYRAFTLNEDLNVSLPVLSAIPWIGASWRRDRYRKELSHPTANHLKFITKNERPHAFLWQSSAEKLSQGVRWGIVKTQSITSTVIASLGQYRIVAHERVMKGLVSNSQALKLKLLDLYQDRFTALQAIESLVNKNSTQHEYSKAFTHYFAELATIEQRLEGYFSAVECSGFNAQSIAQIKLDLHADKMRAQAYLQTLQAAANLRPYNRARGDDSVLEFTKQQMMHGLYELQGLNQDLSYSRTRYFAFTRGELNDFIEDARKEIDDHDADLRNVVTDKHHGIYSAHQDELIAYDFAQDNLSSARQQQVLTAISFIEGWDVLDNKKGQTPTVSNGQEYEELEVYAATRWRTHRSVRAAAKSIGYFLLNIFKGIFVPTRPWAEEDWQNSTFHLNAVALHKQVPAVEPMWKKPVYFVKQLANAGMDIFYGINDLWVKLTITMPEDLVNDWESSKALPSLDEVLAQVTLGANAIAATEKQLLEELLKRCGDKLIVEAPYSKVQLAGVEYELSAGEFNDLLNSMVRGLTGFSSVFTHNLYAKDPVGGVVFTATYLLGIGMIYLPAYSASIFGSNLVNAFNAISYSMASSPLAAAVAGGSTLAEAAAVVWDWFAHGTSGIAANTVYQFGEDPLTIGAYAVAAYTLGYFLVNGVAGHKIPWLSHVLQEDLGADPATGYPLIGAKFAVMLYEALAAHSVKHHEQPDLVSLSHEPAIRSAEQERQLLRFKLVSWLTAQAKMLPKLEVADKLALARQMDALFSKEESKSLKKLLYPERHPSIAFQVFSVPLAYIPAILRVITSPVLSLGTWIAGNPNPVEPMRRAGAFLVDKIKKDLSRLLVVVSNLSYLLYSLMAAVVKLPASLSALIIGRIAGFFDAKPAHAVYRLFAVVHNFMRSLGAFLYPARAMKEVSVAHPTATMLKTEASYLKLLQEMGAGEASNPAATEATISRGLFAQVCGDSVEQIVASPADLAPAEICSRI